MMMPFRSTFSTQRVYATYRACQAPLLSRCHYALVKGHQQSTLAQTPMPFCACLLLQALLGLVNVIHAHKPQAFSKIRNNSVPAIKRCYDPWRDQHDEFGSVS